MPNLILGRKPGQGIYIGRGIIVTVVMIRPDGTVRLSVAAPNHVAVTRDDMTLDQHLKFQRERETAVMAPQPGKAFPHTEGCTGQCLWCLIRMLVAERLGSAGVDLLDDVERESKCTEG